MELYQKNLTRNLESLGDRESLYPRSDGWLMSGCPRSDSHSSTNREEG
ncbi:hypothetical protein [Microcoleus sp. F4-D5]